MPPPAHSISQPAPGSDSAVPSILIIDDALMNATLLARLLRPAGYATYIALCGADGLRLALQHRPGLVMLDINLPDMDGYQVCAQLKANLATAAAPVLFFSALSEPADQAAAFAAGAAGFLAKPVQMSAVFACLRQHLAR